MIRERKCPECGAAFTPRHGNQVCCTTRCKEKRHRRLTRESRINHTPKSRDPRKAMLARLAARDRAYEREYGSPCGRPRGVLAHPLPLDRHSPMNLHPRYLVPLPDSRPRRPRH